MVGPVSENKIQPRKVGLLELLWLVIIFTPIFGTTDGLRHSGAGWLAYLLGVPLGIGIAAVILWMDWRLWKAIGARSKDYSEKAQKALAFGLLVFQVFWAALGGVAGIKLAAFIGDRLTR